MKTKLAIELFLGLTLCGGVGLAQNTQAPGDAKPPAAGGTETQTEASGVSNNVTNEINIGAAPLPKIISTLATAADVKIMFDPSIYRGTNAVSQTNNVEGIHFQNLSHRQVLDAVLELYYLTMKEIPNTGIYRILRQPSAAAEPQFTHIFQLRYAETSNMTSVVNSAFTNVIKVAVDSRTSQLVLTGTSNNLAAVETLLENLDKPTKQVLIEAQLYETGRNPSSVRGIDWAGTLEAQNFGFGNGVTSGETSTINPGGSSTSTATLPSGRNITSTTTSPQDSSTQLSTILGASLSGLSADTMRGLYPHTAFLNADGVRGVLSFLNKDSDTQVISTPRTVTLDNREAKLEVTRAFPIFEITPGTLQQPAASKVTWTNLGTILRVTPRISASSYITLKVMPEVSNIDSKDRQTINGQINEANVYSFRKIETQVVIPSGNTLVMGGLISDTTSKSYSKVPLLGDIPGLGAAFRRESKQKQKQNLLIFITPTILTEADFQPTESTFLKTRRVEMPEPKESFWETGKPRDWSKPSQ